MLTKAVASSVLVFTLMVAAPVFANTITFTGEGKIASVTIQSPTLGVLSTDAGELDPSWVGTPPASQPASFYTYCVDPNHYLLGAQDVTLTDSDFLTAAGVTDAGGKAAWLINTYAPSIHQSGSGADAAALQVAIWEAISDNAPDLSAGSFRVDRHTRHRDRSAGILERVVLRAGRFPHVRNALVGYGTTARLKCCQRHPDRKR